MPLRDGEAASSSIGKDRSARTRLASPSAADSRVCSVMIDADSDFEHRVACATKDAAVLHPSRMWWFRSIISANAATRIAAARRSAWSAHSSF